MHAVETDTTTPPVPAHASALYRTLDAAARQAGGATEASWRAFARIDADADGSISRQDMANWLARRRCAAAAACA